MGVMTRSGAGSVTPNTEEEDTYMGRHFPKIRVKTTFFVLAASFGTFFQTYGRMLCLENRHR